MQTIVSGCAMYFVWMWANIMIRNLQFFRHVHGDCAFANINSLHTELVCTSPFTNTEVSLRSKWQVLPRKPWVVTKGSFA